MNSARSAAIALTLFATWWVPARAAAPSVDFARDVRPILSDRCFQCHGPDAGKRKADLRLDTAEGIATVIKVGQPGDSELIGRVTSQDPDEHMPPAKAGPPLTKTQVDVLKRWIAAGGKYDKHWSFVPPRRPPLPAVTTAGWARNPVDRFVLATLEAKRLTPSPEAERERLIRRVTLDLTGLPPTPAEVAAFVADRSPDAYEKVVDRLLASPAYGERMALPWLDAARYADTHGYQKDNVRQMWAWRDWVIRAFNDNMPFDRFTVEQIAGDMLPNATVDQRIATGFNRNHRINAEGGSIAEEFRVEYVVDRAETTATVWLGLTAGCARCHDHKFDPISQRDFYSLFAFFNNVPEKGVDGGRGNAEPTLTVPVAGMAEKVAVAERRLAETERAYAADTPARRAAFGRWLEAATARAAGGDLADMWTVAPPHDPEATGGVKFKQLPDASLLVTHGDPNTSVYTVELQPGQRKVTGLRLEVLADPSLPGGGPGRSNGNFVLSGITISYKRPDMNEPEDVSVAGVIADYSHERWPVADVIDGKPETGWAIHGSTKATSRTAVFTFAEPVTSDANTALIVKLRHEAKARPKHLIGRFRLALTSAEEPALGGKGGYPADVFAALRTPASHRTPDHERLLWQQFLKVAAEISPARKNVADAKKDLADARSRATTSVMVMKEMDKPRTAYVLKRGQYDQPGDPVTPAIPEALGHWPDGLPSNRLGLARWLVDPTNPLTSRVTVNRYWQMLFGAGLVKTAEDFGNQGQWPTHPELLDWLAVEYRESGWDTKRLLRLLVTSATYRQQSRATPEMFEKDPENRWLSRGPRLRLSGEALRDQALFASGLLVDKVGGPPVKPYQPAGLWRQVAGVNSDTVDYVADHGEGLYRRSLYTFWKRAAAPPGMLIFDASGREACNVRPRTTNTPLQALATMNDVQFVEAARVMAQRMMTNGGGNIDERLRFGWRLVLARPPGDAELKVLRAGWQHHRERYQADPAAAYKLIRTGESPPNASLNPVELAAYTAVVNTILNLDEALTRE